MAEYEMVGLHHQCNEHELEQTLDGEGQGRLMCCSPQDHEESDTTWQVNNNNLIHIIFFHWTNKKIGIQRIYFV